MPRLSDAAIRHLARGLAQLAEQVAAPNGEEEATRLVALRGRGYTLHQETDREYRRLLSALLNKHHWSERVSEKWLDRRLSEILVDLLHSPTAMRAAIAQTKLEELRGVYEDSLEQVTAYLPVLGVVLRDGDLRVGTVTLRVATEGLLEQLADRLQAIVERTLNTPDEQAAIYQQLRNDLQRGFVAGLVSEFNIVAEPGRALERAEEETRRALELLRFAIPVFYPRDRHVMIGLPGDVIYTRRGSLVLGASHYTWNSEIGGARDHLELNRDRLSHLNSLGFSTFSELLGQSNSVLNDFERVLLSALHWFSSAQTQVELENGFLSLMTCLETMLTPRDGSPIGTAVAEGVALILAEELETRRYVKKHLRELYKKRSAVSHGGSKAVLASDYATLEDWAGGMIVRLVHLRERFRSHQDLFDYLDELKLRPVAPAT